MPGCICQLSELMLKLCCHQENREERRSLRALATYTCSFTCSLPALILLFSPFSHPAVHPDQTPEPCHQKRVLENPAALNMKTSGKRKIFIWTSCNRMSGLILLVSLCLLPGIFEGLKEKRLTLASF